MYVTLVGLDMVYIKIVGPHSLGIEYAVLASAGCTQVL